MRIFMAVLIVLLFAACSRQEEPAPAAESMMSEAVSSRPAAKPSAEASTESASESRDLSRQRLLIREASLTLRATDPRATSNRATKIAEAAGGYLLESELSSVDEKAQTLALHLRVPEKELDGTLQRIRALGTVLSEEITGQDVTDEFVDLTARLKTQRTLEARLLSLTENTGKLTDLLTVEQELARVRSTIETIEGRTHSLKERARMASIRLTVAAPDQVMASAPQSIASRFGNAFSSAGGLMIDVSEGLIIALGFLLPFLLLGTVLGLPIWFLVRRNRRARLSSPTLISET